MISLSWREWSLASRAPIDADGRRRGKKSNLCSPGALPIGQKIFFPFSCVCCCCFTFAFFQELKVNCCRYVCEVVTWGGQPSFVQFIYCCTLKKKECFYAYAVWFWLNPKKSLLWTCWVGVSVNRRTLLRNCLLSKEPQRFEPVPNPPTFSTHNRVPLPRNNEKYKWLLLAN